jgi:hypothetical protein
MAKQGDGLTGYTLANGHRLGAWEATRGVVGARRFWKKRGAPAKLAAAVGTSSWSIHRHVDGWHYENSGGCASAKEGRETVDAIMRGITGRMDRDAAAQDAGR